MAPAISADRLTIRFGDFIAVDDVSFAIEKGEVFGLLGPNGSGKTTIIKALCGLITPASGGGKILDFDIRTQTDAIKQRIGYMSQKFSLYPDLTVEENLDFYGGVYGLGGARLRERKQEVVKLTNLGPYLERRAGKLSGGWKQRLALGCAIIHEPAAIFLDEPTAGIDPVARRELWDLLFELSGRGVTLFVTTHYMDEAERCGRVGYIYLSKLIAFGSLDDIKRRPEVSPEGAGRFEVTCKSVASALSFLKNHPEVQEATIFGQSAHVLADARWDADALARLMREAGFGETSVRRIEPSLEDAFVTLTHRIIQEKGE